MSYSVELRDVRKRYGDFQAVDGVSFAVRPGTIFGLLGPNGAGKTTSIRMTMDIIAPDTGEVLLFGRRRTPGDLDRIGYLPEERGLYQKMTVQDHLVFLAELHRVRRRDALPEIERWLDRVGMSQWAKSKVEELSKGMQQKIQLVGTVLHDPEIVILDEPFSGLDPINQGLFKDLLAEYKTRGKTILFSTHIMEQAEKLCDAICLISKGRAVLAGSMAEVKERFGGASYRLVAKGDLERLHSVDGVEHAMVEDGNAKIMLEAGSDPARLLQELVGFLEVHEFRSEAPGLEEIFIKAVNDAA